MATPIIMPKFGQMTEDSAIVEWLKKEGDKVAKGDILFTVETDKSVMEVESFEAGTLLKIVVGVGVSVPVQSTVGFLGKPGEAIPATPRRRRRAASERAAQPTTAPPSRAGARPPRRSRRRSPPADRARCAISGRASALPHQPARRGAGQGHASSTRTRIIGTGPDGRIVEKDVKAYLAANDYASLRVTPAAKALAAKENLDLLALRRRQRRQAHRRRRRRARHRREAEADEQDAADHRAAADAERRHRAALLRHRRSRHDRTLALSRAAQGRRARPTRSPISSPQAVGADAEGISRR